jgi:hypothetical protein
MDIHERKSYTSLSKVYFWTATILAQHLGDKWLPLLENDFTKK